MTEMNDRFFLIDYETTGIDADDVPIEVGIVVTDATWTELASYEALIRSDYAQAICDEHWLEAQAFHGIERSRLDDSAADAPVVAADIAALAEKWKPEDGRLILLSDNIQFEWKHTDWLLSHVGMRCQDVFHYCGWDTSLLSLFTSFQDPKGTDHRALSDARGVLAELRRVREEVPLDRLAAGLLTTRNENERNHD